MFQLVTFYLNDRYVFEAETLDEALSLAIDAFNQSHELIDITKGDILVYHFAEIYEVIGKAVY
jgi:hypothetical protein